MIGLFDEQDSPADKGGRFYLFDEPDIQLAFIEIPLILRKGHIERGILRHTHPATKEGFLTLSRLLNSGYVPVSTTPYHTQTTQGVHVILIRR